MMQQDSEHLKNNNDYNADQIEVLEGIEAVRRRPGMYIGSTSSRGLHQLVFELIDNSVDEALAGYCDLVKIILNGDGSITVSDNGRGIPVDIHPATGRPAVEATLTLLHAGGKFGGHGYEISGGLHGVGLAVVNALSRMLQIEIKRDGIHYIQEYARGKVISPLKKIGATNETGTKVTFFPDSEIFSEIEFNKEYLAARIRDLSYLNKGLRLIFIDQIEGKEKEFHHKGGIADFVRNINKNKDVLHNEPFYFNTTKTAFISLLVSFFMTSASRSGSAAVPQGKSIFSTTAPKISQIFAKRSPKLPIETTTTFSPGEIKFTTAASIPPVPAEGKIITSFFVRKTSFSPSVSPAKSSLNSGPRWLIIGFAISRKTLGGTGVGPGSIKYCFSSILRSSFLDPTDII
jgi:hypothetical protein